MDLIFIPQLFAKALLRRARSVSATVATADATASYDRDSYIIRVLEAPIGIRVQVKDLATAASNSAVFQKHLLVILTLFETLSDEDKANYIVAFKGCATAAGQGSREIVRAHAWELDNIPPRLDP